MINQYIFVFIMMLSPAFIGAQHHYDFNWYIGYEFDGDVIDLSRFNFEGFEFQHFVDTVGLEMSGQNITMSNAEGELLFYSNGCEIKNAQHQTIPGSDPLIPGEDDDIFCSSSLAAMVLAQTMICLPFEISPDTTLYYIYQIRDTIKEVDSLINLYSVYREHLVKEYNNSLKLIYNDSATTPNYIYTGFTQAIKHKNNKDWWLIYPHHLQKYFESVLITDSGSRGGQDTVLSPYQGEILLNSGMVTGQMAVSPNGANMALFLEGREFFYLAFNRQTGKIKVISRTKLNVSDALGKRGVQFSPNGRFIYLGVDSFLYQLDTESTEFPNDPILVAKTLKDHPSGRKDDFSLMQLGPDCKIYINTFSNTDFYHVIHRPNEKGQACMVEVRGIRLKTLNNRTIPLFPNYRLGTPEENLCDSIFDDTTSSSYQLHEQQKKWQLWPNPADKNVKITHEDGNFGLESVEIYTFQGQMIQQQSFEALNITYEMNVSSLPEGMYMLKIQPKVGRDEWHKVVVF